MIIERKHISRMPWEREIGRLTFENIESKIKQRSTSARKEIIDNEPLSKK
jgi:hypothetical protein